MRRILFVMVVAALCSMEPLAAQAGRITGTVTSQDGRPLPGATVSVEGTRAGALTGPDGRYTITGVNPGAHRVTATVIGYSASTQSVNLTAGGVATADFQLTPSAIQLEGIVAVGYGTQRREETTGSVTTVSAQQAEAAPIISPQQLMQGRVAGVQVIENAEPGGGISLRIRGGTSVTGSNEPLYVIDGVPLPVGGGLQASCGPGGCSRNPLNFINPDDIESLTVLKDASSTAIYGSRGANGVVIIQTKSGVTRGPQFTYSSSVSQSNVIRTPDLLSAEQFRAAVQERAPSKVPLLGNANTNWYEEVLRDGAGQEHTLAVNGAGENMNYRLSLGYLGQEGVVQGSTMERFSGSLNYSHSLFSDRLNIRAFVRGARTEDEFTPGGVLGSAAAFAPTQPIQTESGYFEWTQFSLAPNNPLAELELATDEGKTFRSVGNIESEYRLPFLEGLTATTRLGYDVGNAERVNFFPSIMRSQIESPPAGFVSQSRPTETTTVLDAYLNYDTRFGTSSDIDATAGYSYETFRGDYPYFFARGLSSDLLGPSGFPTSAERENRIDITERRLASFFARLNYGLMDRYLLTLSVRRDGSSRFGPENQWGTFPAAAVAWRLSEEPFMPRIAAISDLKLRASWGVNGNQAFGDYLWVSSYMFSDAFTRAQFGNEFVNTIRPSAVDPNIKWEETTSYNLGLDYGLYDNRLSGSIEYYFKDTDDLIFRVPVAAGTNLSNFVTTNIGSVQNQGFEFSLNAQVLDGGRNGLSWDLGFNASSNRNRLLQISAVGGGSEQILVGEISGGVGSRIQVLQPGFPVNSFFVYRHKRDASGRPVNTDTNGDGRVDEMDLYEDLNNDGVVNQSDRSPFKSPAPKWALGHTSNLSYGNFDLSYTLRAHLGSHVYNNVASNLGHYSALEFVGAPINLHSSVLENQFAQPQYFSDVYVEDASFLRMDNITLGFTVPRFRAFQQMRIYGTVQNVFTLTDYSGIDPEAASSNISSVGIDNNIYPRSRIFTAGVSVGF